MGVLLTILKLGCYRQKERKEPQNWGAHGAPPLAVRTWLTPRIRCSSLLLPEFGRSRSNCQSVIKEIRLKVCQGHRNRHRSIPTYDFLLTLHSNRWPISYRFRDNRRYQSKIANFSYLRVFCAPTEGVPHAYRRSESKKLEWWATGPRKKFDDTFSRLDTIHERDRQTDRQTDRHWATAKTALIHEIRSNDRYPHALYWMWPRNCYRAQIRRFSQTLCAWGAPKLELFWNFVTPTRIKELPDVEKVWRCVLIVRHNRPTITGFRPVQQTAKHVARCFRAGLCLIIYTTAEYYVNTLLFIHNSPLYVWFQLLCPRN